MSKEDVTKYQIDFVQTIMDEAKYKSGGCAFVFTVSALMLRFIGDNVGPLNLLPAACLVLTLVGMGYYSHIIIVFFSKKKVIWLAHLHGQTDKREMKLTIDSGEKAEGELLTLLLPMSPKIVIKFKKMDHLNTEINKELSRGDRFLVTSGIFFFLSTIAFGISLL